MAYHIPRAIPYRPRIHPIIWIPWIGGLLSIGVGVYRFNTMVPPKTGTMYDHWLLPKGLLGLSASGLCIGLVVVSSIAFWTRYRRNTWRTMTGLSQETQNFGGSIKKY